MPRTRALFLAWLALFAGISFLLWAAIRFWGDRSSIGAPPPTGIARAGRGLRVLPPQNRAPVLELEEVTQSNAKLSFVGRTVRFENVTVTEAGERTFRVGRGNGPDLLVVPWEAERADVRTGEQVTVGGLILNVPGITILQSGWMLDTAGIARAQREQVYLRAPTIKSR